MAITISIPFLEAINTPQSIIEWTTNYFASKGITQEDYDTFGVALQQYCNQNASTTFDWMYWYKSIPSNPKAIEYFPNWFYVNNYKLYDVITQEELFFTTLSAAQSKLTEIQNEYALLQSDRYSVNIILPSGADNQTWESVDPFNFDTQATYQVFNTFTGQYIHCIDLQSAKNAQAQMQKLVGESGVNQIYQEVSSADGQQTGWQLVE